MQASKVTRLCLKEMSTNQRLADPLITDTGSDLNVYLDDSAGGCCSATKTMALDLKGEDLNEWFGKYNSSSLSAIQLITQLQALLRSMV
jgi:hypothetical protein